MRHRLSSVAFVALSAVMVVSVAACSSTASPSGSAGSSVSQVGLAEQTTKIGDIEVKVTPTQLDSSGAAFFVVLDTHAGSLDADLAGTSTLEVGGATWPVAGWEGAPSGGHHREGTLRFRAAGPPGAATLTVGGLSGPARFTWNPPATG